MTALAASSLRQADWEGPDGDEANLAWARGLYGELDALTRGGTYLNFGGFGEEGQDLVRRANGDNYARLQAVKATYDPENVFRSNFNVVAA
ncbi:MAG TPA: BBE domain-containing protein [Gaiellaceae bacterium]|nr:BBE domain-containing protein [Gaiellaceae bacterium]